MNLIAFGNTVLGLRSMRRLSQTELATQVSALGATMTPAVTLSAATLGQIEAGKSAPRIDVVWATLKVLNLDNDLIWALILAELAPGDTVLPVPLPVPVPAPPPPPPVYPVMPVATGGMTANGNTYQLRVTGHGLVTGDRVQVSGVGTLMNAVYWVKVVTADFFTLWGDQALTVTVSAVASAGAGTAQKQ